MNVVKVFGQHIKDSGVCEAWVEAGILGAGTAEHVMTGKAYNKGMRSHKLMSQALWRLLLPFPTDHVEIKDPSLMEKITALLADEHTDKRTELLKSS